MGLPRDRNPATPDDDPSSSDESSSEESPSEVPVKLAQGGLAAVPPAQTTSARAADTNARSLQASKSSGPSEFLAPGAVAGNVSMHATAAVSSGNGKAPASHVVVPPRPVAGVFEAGSAGQLATRGVDPPMIFEVEPADNLVVIGNAAGCAAWIPQAIESSKFVALVKTPAAPATTLIVEAKMAEKYGAPADVRQRPWVALRVRRKTADPRLPLMTLNSLCEVLVDSGVEPRTLVPIDSRSYLLISAENSQPAAAALVRLGHLVSPSVRVCPHVELPSPDPERLRQHVGAWSLSRRESGPRDAAVVQEFGADRAGTTIRVQAPGGLFAEFRALLDSTEGTQASCFGRVSTEGSDGSTISRHTTVSFQPHTGSLPPSLRVTFQGTGENVVLQEETLNSASGERTLERWAKMPGNDAKITVLELVPGTLERDAPTKRLGLWAFCGRHFVRVLGPPRGQGVVGSACCRSTSQLEMFRGVDIVRADLRGNYEAVVGDIPTAGMHRVGRDAWDAAKTGTTLYDAKIATTTEGKKKNRVSSKFSENKVL